jgi:hypothetical protein
MNSLESDRSLFRRYLLGELSEEERLALEERYFAHEDVFAALLAVEDDLVEAHLGGTLSAGERAAFERLFLSTPGSRRQIRLAEDLRGRISGDPRVRTTPAPRPIDALRPAAIAAAVLLAVAASLWLARGRDDSEPTVDRNAAENRTPPPPMPSPDVASPGSASIEPRPPASAPRSVLTVTLAAGLVRDAGAPKAFAIPGGTATVRLWLPLAREDFTRYRVSLQTPDGRELVSQDGMTARDTPSGRALEARIPSKLLELGTYVAIVSGATPDGGTEAAGEYVFRVTRGSNRARP